MPTIFDAFVKPDGNVRWMLFDTAGQEDYSRIRPLSYPKTDVFVVCFALDDVRSFVSVNEYWVPHLEHYYKNHSDQFDTKPKYVFVGTKSDLLDDERRETVSDERVREMMKEFGTHIENVGYFKCSAKSGKGVRGIFDSVRDAMLGKCPTARRRRSKGVKHAASHYDAPEPKRRSSSVFGGLFSFLSCA